MIFHFGGYQYDSGRGSIRCFCLILVRPASPGTSGCAHRAYLLSAFPNGTLPTWKDLQGLTGGRPAFLVAYDYHTIWMNREALREFGITRKTEKVIFAEKLEKDGKTGEPMGM